MRKNSTQKLLGLLSLLLLSASVYSQGVVTIDPNTQRFVGTESTFDRAKYLTFHNWFKTKDADFEKFKKEFNIDPKYNGSRMFNNPAQKHKNGVYPKIDKRYKGTREVSDFVSTSSPKFLFYDDKVDYGAADITEFSKKAASFAADYFSYEADEVPKYYEPFNEPMVHAGDFVPKEIKGKDRTEKVDAVVLKIIEHQLHVAQAIHATPELKNMLVAGYGSAFPEFEANDFGLWEKRYKNFIDIAGKETDLFTLHLYDGSGINNKGGRRSGANSEAILDLIEAYSYKALGEVKPYAITEYGRLVPDQPNYQKNGNYVPLVNAQAVRSQMHLVMNFIERGDNLLLSTPFTIGKAKPNATYSKSSLWLMKEDGSYELSQRRFFFEVWKDVKGDRVYFNSTNVDVQTQAFVSGNQLFVVLNNLNDETQNVKLAVVGDNKLKNVEVKRLNIYEDKLPELTKEICKEAPSSIAINYGETIVLTYNFKSDLKFNNKVVSTKYYTQKYLQAIEAAKPVSFKFNKVNVGEGVVSLRVGVGRDHGLALTPSVKINGKEVKVEGDLVRGYDQNNRSRFFGTLEIPVRIELLKAGENTVDVTFPDAGGHITSVILQVQKADKKLVGL